MISIRSETPADYAAVRKVIVDAFTECDYGYNGEAELVDQLRSTCDNLLALVATEGEMISRQQDTLDRVYAAAGLRHLRYLQ